MEGFFGVLHLTQEWLLLFVADSVSGAGRGRFSLSHSHARVSEKSGRAQQLLRLGALGTASW